jgi:hypothetical protein
MDLVQLDTVAACNKGAVMPVRSPKNGAILMDESVTPPAPVAITLRGRDSTEFQRLQREQRQKNIDMATKRGVRDAVTEIVENEQRAMDVYVACTVNWSGFDWEGKSLPCTPENARMIYTRLPWLREQVDAFINDRANFLGN